MCDLLLTTSVKCRKSNLRLETVAVSGDAPANAGDTCSNLQSRIVMGHWESEVKAGIYVYVCMCSVYGSMWGGRQKVHIEGRIICKKVTIEKKALHKRSPIRVQSVKPCQKKNELQEDAPEM